MLCFKYVVVENSRMESVFLFPSWEKHADVAAKLDGHLLSAGFVRFVAQDAQVIPQTYGRSHSLDLDSRPQDADLIAMLIKNN